MNERKLSASMLTAYDRWLRQEERADATREKYLRSIRAFAAWLGGAAVTKDAVTEWKAHLAGQHQAPSTVNTALAALNGLFRFLGWEDCRAKFLKVQRRIFRAPERELTRAEYARLFAAAQSGTDDKAFYERFRGIYRQASSAAAEDQCFAEPELCDAIMYAALRARAGQSAALAMLAALDPEGK